MFRRDEFLDLLGDENANDVLEKKLKDLEKFVDDELRKSENIVRMINSTSASTLPPTVNGLEIVNQLKTTNIIHKDITVENGTKIRGGGSNGVFYSLWEDNLKYSNSDASLTPWVDKTILETWDINFIFNGILRIKCPDNTNKFLAKILADKYMNAGKTDSSGKFIGGFWSIANRPNDEKNKTRENTILNDAVQVLYDKTNNIVYLEFKLY
jgi:hypothetical protein